MSKVFKPLLASPVELDTLTFPKLISPKLDGIRCIIKDGVALSRSLKPIPNAHVQALFGRPELEGLDGELICGNPAAPDVYRVTNSAVMSKDGEPDVRFYAFDRYDLDAPFQERLNGVAGACALDRIEMVPHITAENMDELLQIEARYLELGFEGVMLRDPAGRYKNGRSTAKEGILMKLKRFTDAEYKVIGFEERMGNANEAKINALGYTERSSHKENKFGRGDLGALVCETPDGQVFNCGTGFDDATRAEIWANRDAYLGKFAKIKSFLIGVKDLPRFPVFIGWRAEEDMS